jgi:hypothetical protein
MASESAVERPDDRLVRLLDEASDVLSQCVVPLYRNEGGKPAHFGTGFFIRAGSSHFVLSAAHVLERSRELYYYVEPSVTARLSGSLRLNPWDGDREKDPIDIGVLKLDKSMPPYPAVGKLALDASYLRPGLLPRANRFYATIGFPAKKSKANVVEKNVISTVYSFRNRSFPDSDYGRFGFSPDTHIVLNVDLRDGVDSDGQHRTFPKPQGMSGGPIFMLLDETSEGQPRSFPIVGIGTKYRPSQHALIGTDVKLAAEWINEAI